MHRRLIASVIAVAAVAALPATAGAAPSTPKSDVPKGQACADIVPSDGWYRDAAWTGTGAPTTTTVFQLVNLAEPSCLYKNGKPASYKVEVYSTDTTSDPPVQGTLIDVQTVNGDGVSQSLTFVFELATTPAAVCTVASTSIAGKVVDRAPDTGCERWILDATDSGGRGTYK